MGAARPAAAGAPSGHGRLVVTADDFGLTRATSAAIVEAHRHGIVTATSILAVAPATTATLGLLADAPDLEPGVHLAFVGEDPPVCEARAIPTLVDRRGRLAASWRQLLPRLAAGRVDPDDLVREAEAQVALVVDAGISPTHLNAHQHLQLWPAVASVVADVAVRHGIGYVRTPTSGARGPRGAGVRALASRLATTLGAHRLATGDGFLGLDEAGAWSEARLVTALGGARGEVVELNVHPGADVDPDRSRYAWGYRWAEERRALGSPAVRAAVGDRVLAGPSGRSAPTA